MATRKVRPKPLKRRKPKVDSKVAPKTKNDTDRDVDGRFAPGNKLPGKKRGRPKGVGNKVQDSLRKDLQEAIKYVETERGKSIMVHLVEQAMEDNKVLIHLAKKLIPDLKQIDAKVDTTVKGKVTITHTLDMDEKLIQGLPKPPDIDNE